MKTSSNFVKRLGNVLDVAAKTENKDSWVDYLEVVKRGEEPCRLFSIIPEEKGFVLEIMMIMDVEQRVEAQVQHMRSRERHKFRRCFICRNVVAPTESWFYRGISLTSNIYLQIPICVKSKCHGLLTFETETEAPPRNVCGACYDPKVSCKCNFCKSAVYCTENCRFAHWEKHKHMCKKLAKIYLKKKIKSSKKKQQQVLGNNDTVVSPYERGASSDES